MNYKRSIKELDQIRRFRNKGKKLFLNELESANSIDDLKRIIKHHVTVFFDEINFMYSLSGRSLQLISDVSKRNKEMSKSTEADDFSDGKVQKTMKGIVDEIQRFKEQKSRQKQSRGKKMVSDDFLDVERLRNTMKVKRINDELLQHLESSLRWVIHYCRKHDIPLPEEDKIIDLCNKAIEIEKKLPKISDESLQGDKKTRTDDKFTEPNIERYIRF